MKAIPQPIDLWKNPEGKLALEMNEKELNIYFNCWDINASRVSYFGALAFTEVLCCRTLHQTSLNIEVAPHDLVSYLLKIENSPWLKECSESLLNNHKVWSKREASEFSHYAVESKGLCIEIIAKHYSVKKINYSDAADLKAIIHIIS